MEYETVRLVDVEEMTVNCSTGPGRTKPGGYVRNQVKAVEEIPKLKESKSRD